MLKPITEESANRIACLVIGKYGLGKTSLIRTIFGQEYNGNGWKNVTESEDRVCVLSAESGLLAVRDLVTAGVVEGYEIGSLQDFKEAYELLKNNAEMKKRYQWIFIDSLTEIAARCEEVMHERYPDPSKSFRMWGDYTKTMEKTIKGFRDMHEYNVVFVALETEDKDEINRRIFQPAIAGKGLKEKLPSYFDEVFYLRSIQEENNTDRRVFYTQPINEYPAKDRSGKLEPIEEPNLMKIKNKILN